MRVNETTTRKEGPMTEYEIIELGETFNALTHQIETLSVDCPEAAAVLEKARKVIRDALSDNSYREMIEQPRYPMTDADMENDGFLDAYDDKPQSNSHHAYLNGYAKGQAARNCAD
jgi:hypothetical protein